MFRTAAALALPLALLGCADTAERMADMLVPGADQRSSLTREQATEECREQGVNPRKREFITCVRNKL